MDGGYKTIDEYIDLFPEEVKVKLEAIRKQIEESAPEAVEKICYGMPTYYLNGNLVHFAAYKKHIGFYPTPSAITAFMHKLTEYKTSKGAVQFPMDEELPIELIAEMVRFRVRENMKTDG